MTTLGQDLAQDLAAGELAGDLAAGGTAFSGVRAALNDQLIGFWQPNQMDGDDIVDQTGGGSDMLLTTGSSTVVENGLDGLPVLDMAAADTFRTADFHGVTASDRMCMVIVAKVDSLTPASRQVLASFGSATAAGAHISIETAEGGRFLHVWDDDATPGETSSQISGNFTTDWEVYELHYDPRARCGYISGTEYQHAQDEGTYITKDLHGVNTGMSIGGAKWTSGFGCDMEVACAFMIDGYTSHAQRIAYRGALAAVFPTLSIAVEASDESEALGFATHGFTNIPARRVNAGGVDRTFIGALTVDGENLAYEWDHDSDALTRTVLASGITVDLHNRPAFLERVSDGKLFYFRGGHNKNYLYKALSDNARDSTAWGTETDIGADTGTYVYPLQMGGLANDPIYVFFRGNPGGHKLMYRKSTDDGGTWGLTEFIRDGATSKKLYLQCVPNGDSRIDMIVSDGNPYVDSAVSIYYAYFDGTSLYQADGTAITGSAPYDVSNLELIYDGSTTRGWLEDIAVDSSGNPHLLYSVFNASKERRAQRWTGSAWSSAVNISNGSRLFDSASWEYHTGGCVFDKEDPDQVFLSEVDAGQHEIFRYATSDSGASWSQAEQLTSGSKYAQVGPLVPINRHATEARVIWMSYRNYAGLTNDAGDWWGAMHTEGAW